MSIAIYAIPINAAAFLMCAVMAYVASKKGLKNYANVSVVLMILTAIALFLNIAQEAQP